MTSVHATSGAERVDTLISPEDAQAALEKNLITCLEQIFGRLRAAGIPFCLLRNRDRIPGGLIEGSDIDLVVPANISAERLAHLLADLKPVHVFHHRYVTTFYFRTGPIFLEIDFLNCDQQWRGATYLENREILARAWSDRDIPVAFDAHQALVALVQKLIFERSVPSRYAALISGAARDSSGEFVLLLHQVFGQQLGRQLQRLAEQGELQEMTPLASRCRRALVWRSLRKRPVATLRGRIAHVISEVSLRVHPPGLDVLLLGPDGAGKTTLCSILAQTSPPSMPFRSIRTQSLFARALPRLSRVGTTRIDGSALHKDVVRNPNPYLIPAHTRMLSALKYIYYALDQWVYQIRAVRHERARNTLRLHDRHMVELGLLPERYRYSGPVWLARWITRVIPKPELVILLDAPAQVFQARKQEVPLETTERELEIYRALITTMPGGRTVNAAQPLDQVVADAQETIVDFLEERTMSRLGCCVQQGQNRAASRLSSQHTPTPDAERAPNHPAGGIR